MLAQLCRTTRGQFWSQFWFTHVSRVLRRFQATPLLEHVLENLGSLCLCSRADQVQNSHSLRTDCPVTTGVALQSPHLSVSSVHKSRSVVECLLVFAEPVQELSFCYPIRKIAASFRIQSYFTYCVVLLVISRRVRLVNSAKNSSLSISIWRSRIRALGAVRTRV